MIKFFLLFFAILTISFSAIGCAPSVTPKESHVFAGQPVAIVAGEQNSMLVVDDGSLLGWGWYVNVPGAARAFYHNPVYILSDVAYVASLNLNEVSTFTIRADASLWAWGDNALGQLGDGTNRNRSTPVHIADDILALSAGNMHVLAITTDMDLIAWGSNSLGQLGTGDGSPASNNQPVHIAQDIITVSAGHSHSLAITSTYDLLAWGNNENGQIGNGTKTTQYSPTHIKNNVIAIASGHSHSLAITTNNQLWAWGSNSHGQLASNAPDKHLLPVFVMDNISAVFAYGASSMAITLDGALYAWGELPCSGTAHSPHHIMDNVTNVSMHGGSVLIVAGNAVYQLGRYMVGHYYNAGTHFCTLSAPVRIVDEDGFIPSAAHIHGRWRLVESTEFDMHEALSAGTSWNYIFYEYNTGYINEGLRRDNAVQITHQNTYTWNFDRDSTLRIVFDNNVAMYGIANIQRLQNSQGRKDLLTWEGEDFTKHFFRLMP